MATKTRNPTSEVAVTGTWSGTNRHLLLDDHPDSGNPIADGTTCSAAGILAMGFSAFDVPAGSSGISVQVLYYDFKNGTGTAANGALIRCNDTTNRLAGSHNPGNGNANIALRTVNYATNPKSAAAWTVNDVNGVGANGLTAFGISVTDASPTSTISSAILQVTYTPPVLGTLGVTLGALAVAAAAAVSVGGTGTPTLGVLTASGTAVVSSGVAGTLSSTLSALTETGTGGVAVAATSVPTLGAATLSGTAAVTAGPVGTLAATLGALTLTGSAATAIVASAAPTLGALTQTASAQVALDGDLAASLGALTSSSAAALEPVGQLAQTLAAASLSATATMTAPEVHGTLNVTLGGGTGGAQRGWIFRGHFIGYYQ